MRTDPKKDENVTCKYQEKRKLRTKTQEDTHKSKHPAHATHAQENDRRRRRRSYVQRHACCDAPVLVAALHGECEVRKRMQRDGQQTRGLEHQVDKQLAPEERPEGVSPQRA